VDEKVRSLTREVATTLDEHWDMVWTELEAGVEQVAISTFGTNRHTQAGEVFWALNDQQIPCRVLIGAASTEDADRIGQLLTAMRVSYLKHVRYKMTMMHHMKLWLFWRGDAPRVALIGGRNLTNSGWMDVTVRVTRQTQVRKLTSVFDRCWRQAKWRV